MGVDPVPKEFGCLQPEPEIWVPVTQHQVRGKRVNLLRDERGLTCVYIHFLVFMGVGMGVNRGPWHPLGFEFGIFLLRK